MEIWKEIKGFEGIFSVSEDGRIKSHKRPWVLQDVILTPQKNKFGYLQIRLGIGFNNYKTYKVHRLVADAFIPNPLELSEINHLDGNKLNNCINNLEWCSRSKNMKHAYDKRLVKITKEMRDTAAILAKNRKGGLNPKSRKVINKNTNKIYGSIKEASDDLNMNYGTLFAMIHNINPNKSNIVFYNSDELIK